MIHVSNSAVDIMDEGMEDVIPDFSGWLVYEDEAAIIHQAITLFLLTVPEQTDFRSRLCEINRALKDHFKQKGGVK